ncbi:MAG: caspase family protein [Alphaproteobacteria bacterium]|nr:caspase family protein [Alphaproteobacteria bacterium]MCW5744466.1 caspase family protein [Alphaproteobacteria bacterium]
MRRILALFAFALGLVALASAASAERRVALVIGNAAYQHAPPLANPANDARAVAAALERLGFDVVSGFDLGNADLRKTVRSFADKLAGADVALFFYAGHGLQVSGENYLIPVDAAIQTEADLDFNAVKMDLVSRQMERETKVKIVMLDACRDNPFEKQLSRSMGKTRSAALKKGLAEVNTAGGSIIAFATDPGDVALDGDGKHSPFTEALLRHIETPGVEIGLMMRRVTKDVFEKTKEKQRPWTNASLTGEFYMKPGEPSATPAPAPTAGAAPPAASSFDERQMELAFWQSADKSGAAKDYEEYLKRYPNGQFAGMAKNRLEALKNKPDAPRTAAADQGQQGRSVDAAAASKNADEATELAIGLTANDRTGIQRRLLLAGFNPNGVDGAFGPGTRRAITGWQTSRGFQPTGYLNRDQYGALIAQTETAYANWLASERARAAATPAPTYQPQPTAQPAPTAQPQPTRPTSTARDVIDGVGTVRDMIRIFR